jgi:hypothetical protein
MSEQQKTDKREREREERERRGIKKILTRPH